MSPAEYSRRVRELLARDLPEEARVQELLVLREHDINDLVSWISDARLRSAADYLEAAMADYAAMMDRRASELAAKMTGRR